MMGRDEGTIRSDSSVTGRIDGRTEQCPGRLITTTGAPTLSVGPANRQAGWLGVLVARHPLGHPQVVRGERAGQLQRLVDQVPDVGVRGEEAGQVLAQRRLDEDVAWPP